MPNETCDGKISDNLPNADIRTTQIQYGVRSTSINSQLWIAVDKEETGVSFLFPHAVILVLGWSGIDDAFTPYSVRHTIF